MKIVWRRTTDARVAHAFPSRLKYRPHRAQPAARLLSLCGHDYKGSKLHTVDAAKLPKGVRLCAHCSDDAAQLAPSKVVPIQVEFLRAGAELQSALRRFSAATEALTKKMTR